MFSQKPKMILFDYGHTLLAEPEWDYEQGAQALLRCAVKNPNHVQTKELAACIAGLWKKFLPALRMNMDHHEHHSMRLTHEILGLEFAAPLEELEILFWDHCTKPVPQPHIQELLDFLAQQRIRTGVVSNMTFSGHALTARITKWLSHEFEFIIASSEYGVRKPDPMIFQLATVKAGLPPEDIWFCGDNPRCDVDASHAAGMRPVWYNNDTHACPFRDESQPEPQSPHLHLHGWEELIKFIKEMPKTP